MITRTLPETLYRVHANADGPTDPSPASGGGRFDDFRIPPQFHVLYTADSVEGCFIEKLQRFRGSDQEALDILNAITHSGSDQPVLPLVNQIPADVLRNLAVSTLRVLDTTQKVIQIDDLRSILPLREIGKNVGIDLPDLKPGDVLHSDHTIPQRLSVIVYESQGVVGTAARSSLDSPGGPNIHTNLNLYRETPEHGSMIRALLQRVETHRALDHYRLELNAAIEQLNAKPALPLDHPDLTIHS